MTTTTWVRSSNDDTTYYGQVVGWFGGAVPFTGSLRRKTAFHRWLPFWRGVKTRDPLFNRSVYALGTDGLATFLDSDGAQSAAMDLVGEGAMIKVYPGNVDVIAASDRPIVETRLEAETAVFMAHVEAYAEVHRA